MSRPLPFFTRLLAAWLLLLSATLHAQTQTEPTYAEKLGWPKGSRVVILHIDDAGMSYDSNLGTIQALEKGVATSVSVMMPCPWVPGFVRYLKEHPGVDAGLHLTLTAEWKDYRWGPLTGTASKGLVDPEGALWRDVAGVVQHATPDEVEAEIRAQLARAQRMGFAPTHLDSHMGTLFAHPAFLERYLKLGIETGIPVMFPGGHNTLIAQQMGSAQEQLQQARLVGKRLWDAGLPVLDDLHNDTYGWNPPAGTAYTPGKGKSFKTERYITALKTLQPGVTMIIMHCTAPTEVFKHISDSGASREGDLLAMLDPALRQAIRDEKIILTTWRELKERRVKAGQSQK